ncbi:MAG: divergent PAP2 family protein [Ignavibacteriales bacterium]|nr:divergent PAP2 family protein [Ignavibacteriales bacterium]
MKELFSNQILWTAIIADVEAQILKAVLVLISERRWRSDRLFGPGDALVTCGTGDCTGDRHRVHRGACVTPFRVRRGFRAHSDVRCRGSPSGGGKTCPYPEPDNGGTP